MKTDPELNLKDATIKSPSSISNSKKSSRKKKEKQHLYAEMIDMAKHNLMKRDELSGMNLNDIRQLHDTSVVNMIAQSKMTNELKKL